tara:strand:+ start:6132 stop:6851 length:720 start_codon:yes stop_codon:yes gene_type:complete
MSLSIIVPVYNEENQLISTIKRLSKIYKKIKEFEIIFIDDFSNDRTNQSLKKLEKVYKKVKFFKNTKKGLGPAIDLGIKKSKKKFVCFFMCDSSDDVNDLIKYYSIINNNDLDAVLGSRFMPNSKITNYPIVKLILNRIFNYLVKIIFFSDYNDFTNAFKIYRRKTLYKLMPLVSDHFNIFLELPLKIVSRKFKYSVVPIKWKGRKIGISKFKIKELGSMYLFTLMYCFIEKILLKKTN